MDKDDYMQIFTLEHSKESYIADFVLYGLVITLLLIFILFASPPAQWLFTLSAVLIGLISWTLIEYGMHRFVLHGLQPFRSWHEEHHARPTALICTPLILSTSLILILVFLPLLILTSLWTACAITLGILLGYLVYAIVHHLLHHGYSENRWVKQRKQWHGLHHSKYTQEGYFGVTTAFWDHLFRSRGDQG